MMNATALHARFEGPIVMIGFGSIGKGTLPLIERHIAFDRAKFTVIAKDDANRHLLDERFLANEVIGRRVAVGLVVRIDRDAERRGFVIERRDEIIGAAVVEVHQRPRDAENGVRGPTVGRGHRPEAVEHLKDESVSVE